MRRRCYGQAIRLISEQAYLVPLNTYVTTYGISRGLAFRPHPDELPRIYLAGWR
jgi:peptide/nickel transport system substrate-binding protein